MFIKGFDSFRKERHLITEGIIFSKTTMFHSVNPQIEEALSKIPKQKTVSSILDWIKKTLLSTKSPMFILRRPIEELKSTGGVGGTTLPANYHGVKSTIEPNLSDYQDKNYYDFMRMSFDIKGSILSDPADSPDWDANGCGLKIIEDACLKQLKDNKMPFFVIKYCFKKVRKEMAKSIQFIEKEKSRTNLQYIPPGTKEGKIPINCFLDEKPTNHIPELKKLLLDVKFRDVEDFSKVPAERKKIHEPIIKKKREAFYNYFTKTIYSKFQSIVDKIDESEVDEYLKRSKINVESGKKSYEKGDTVVYLKKDKTIEDWNSIKDKDDLDPEERKKVVGQGTISSVEDDKYKIEYKPGEFAIKSSDEILKKIEKKETEEEEQSEEGKSEKKSEEKQKKEE